MALNRDSNLSGASIDRTHGNEFVPSPDPLGAHPLASMPLDAPTLSQFSTPPRYVPYTPRQRPVTTTGSTTHAIPSSPPNGDATSKLQLQRLKAAVQSLGVDNDSIGWALLEKTVAGENEGPEWDDIWNVLASGSVTLLLPTEEASNDVQVNPGFVRDHIAFCTAPFRDSSPLVTLGGLHGYLNDHKVVIRTAISTHHKRFGAIKRPSTRANVLSSLPPLPRGSDPGSPFPTFSICHLSSLILPPRPMPSTPAPASTRQHAPVSRLANPFASLFSSRSSVASPPAVPPRSSSPRPASIRSEASIDHPNPHSVDGHMVSVFVIDHKIARKGVAETTSKALRSLVQMELDGLPTWLADCILGFTAPLQPFHSSPLEKLKDPSSPMPTTRTASSTIVDIQSAHAMAHSFQTFYDKLEEDLHKSESLQELHPRVGAASHNSSVAPPDPQNRALSGLTTDASHLDNSFREKAVKDALERVEACIGEVFYDQMFLPEESDDASHDEALSSRIAALSMLDLGWQHLGVEMDDGASDSEGVNKLVVECGKILEGLHDHANRSPKAKADVLVAVHKEIVENLSNLPPLRLKPESEEVELESAELKAPPQHATKGPQANTAESQSSLKDAQPLMPLGSPRTMLDSTPLRDNHNVFSTPADKITTVLSAEVPTETTISDSMPVRNTPVNTDVILPIIIYSVVKANPIQLVSQLLFIERFRSKKVGGEEGYCLINFLAAVEFLERVDMQALGLGEADRVMSTHDLTPIPITDAHNPSSSVSVPAGLRGRVEQQVGELTHSATRVFSGVGGVVDSSFTAIRGLLGPSIDAQNAPAHDGASNRTGEVIVSALARPGFGLLRRGASLSIAGVTASLPGASKKGDLEESSGRQLLEVPSRRGSIRETDGSLKYYPRDDERGYHSSEDEGDGGDEDGADTRVESSSLRDRSDTRSIRSFSAMMGKDAVHEEKERMSLSERLANMPALSRETGGSGTPPGSRSTSFLLPSKQDAPAHGSHLTHGGGIAPPNSRFLECDDKDLRVGEIPVLLAEYRRVVAALRVLGGFHEGVP